MPQLYEYQPTRGSYYAQSFALYQSIPESQRLFYYSENEDCTNFISQCVWAAYGGWIPGFTPEIVSTNKSRILEDVRQTKGVWYGSAKNIGSPHWCRVTEFYEYVTNKHKNIGPNADMIAEGTFETVDPSVLQTGDVVQMVVTSYIPDRYGHALFVTKGGDNWEDILICCHTYDRLNTPMNEFSGNPDIYSKLRVLRFGSAHFNT